MHFLFFAQDAMTELHGVLMHGDAAGGEDHAREDEAAAAERAQGPAGAGGGAPSRDVQDPHRFVHDGDADPDAVHSDAPRMDVGPRGNPMLGSADGMSHAGLKSLTSKHSSLTSSSGDEARGHCLPQLKAMHTDTRFANSPMQHWSVSNQTRPTPLELVSDSCPRYNRCSERGRPSRGGAREPGGAAAVPGRRR